MSIFDRPYYESLFGGREIQGEFAIDWMDDFIEFEKLYLTVSAEIKNELVATFPVQTIALIYKDGKFEDEDFARWCSKHNMKWADSNFFVSADSAVLSNCCFDGSQEIIYQYHGKPVVESFEALYNKPEVWKDQSFKIFHKGNWVDGRPTKVARIEKMYKVTLVSGQSMICTESHLHPLLDRDIPTKLLSCAYMLSVYDSPIENLDLHNDFTIENPDDYALTAYGTKAGVRVRSVEYLPEYKPEYVYCFEMVDKSNPYFTLANGIITHNCRLLSDSTKFTGFINSLGSGGLEIGSIKVATQDLYHIALESGFDREKFFDLLKEKTVLNCKFLDVQRHTIKRNIEKGLLPNYGPGGVNFDRQFSTIGILGLYEVLDGFGLIREDEFGYHYYTPEADKMADDILDTINHIKDEFPVDYNFNIEAIPGERAAVILAQKSKLIYGSKWDILGNQWIPLSVKCTMNEKIRVSARLDKGVGGGVISHYNAEAPFVSEEQAWDLLNHIAKNGVIYFAFNYKINECENHHLFLGSDICPRCGKGVYDVAVRVVGFIEPKRYFSKERKTEFSTRQWFEYAKEKFE